MRILIGGGGVHPSVIHLAHKYALPEFTEEASCTQLPASAPAKRIVLSVIPRSHRDFWPCSEGPHDHKDISIFCTREALYVPLNILTVDFKKNFFVRIGSPQVHRSNPLKNFCDRRKFFFRLKILPDTVCGEYE